MNRNFPVRGVADLDRFLSAFPKKLETAAYRQALTAAAAPIRDAAKSRAPGRIKGLIKSGSPRKNQDGSFSIRVYVDERKGSIGFVGYFIEYGVRPHLIIAPGAALDALEGSLKPLKSGRRRSRATLMRHLNRKERDGSLVIDGKFVGPVIRHPGFGPKPFLRPALDMMAEEAVRMFGDKIRAFIEGKTGFAVPLDEVA